MKRVLLFLIVPALVAAFALTSDTSYSVAPQGQPEYLALGASTTATVGASDPAKGYVPLFRDFLEEELNTDLFLNNLAVPGHTSDDINTVQLPTALKELRNPKNDVKVVTVASGGNDLLQFSRSPDFLPCVFGPAALCFANAAAVLDTFEDNFEKTLKDLRKAAGPDTTIIVMTQYNALLKDGCDPFGIASLATGALEGIPSTPIAEGLNDRIRATAADHGAEVADTFGPFAANPNANVNDDCIHPKNHGHAEIAEQFIEAFNG